MTDHSLAIESQDLTRRFGDLVAVESLSLQVPKGTVYGFLGANGAGKTTTIRMLLGLIRPDGGTIRVLGDAVGITGKSRAHRVGALVESPSIYPHLTGRENLEVTRRMLRGDRKRIDSVLAIVNLTAAGGRRAGEYSLGMKQRLGLAQSLMCEPELLILDEPTNGLDPAGIQEIRGLIRALAADSGVTIFLSSHLLSEVEQVADAVGIIDRGRLRFEGTLDELTALSRPVVTVRVHDTATALRVLRDAGRDVVGSDDGSIRLGALEDEEIASVNARLVQAGVAVYRITKAKPSLEELFLSMTQKDVSAS